MHNHMCCSFIQDVDVNITRDTDELVVTIKGDVEKISTLEKKIKAMKELCSGSCECKCSCT